MAQKNPVLLAASGIHEESEVEKAWENIMFPIEKEALLNDVARGMSGNSFLQQGYFSKLFTSKDMM